MKSLLALLTVLPGILNKSPLPSRHFVLEKLAPGVWAAIQNDQYGHAICNAGIIDLGDKTLVFDPFITPEAARDLKSEAEKLTGRKVTLVVDSHFHNDHIRGNQVFAGQASILATEWTRNQIVISEPEEQGWEKKNARQRANMEQQKIANSRNQEKEEAIMWFGYYDGIDRSLPELRITPPTLTFSDSLWIHGKKLDAKLLEFRNGHTGSDVILFIPKAGIAFMGDLLFVNRHPWLGDGDPENWAKILKQFDPENQYSRLVPGHGPVAGKDELVKLENYLEDLHEMVETGLKNQEADSIILKKPVQAPYKNWWYGRFYKPNIRFLINRIGK